MNLEKDSFLDSAESFRSFFNNSPIGLIVADAQERILQANPFACKMFGYRENELQGQLTEVLIPEVHRESHRNQYQGYFIKPNDWPRGQARALYARKKSGALFPAEVSLGHCQLGGKNVVLSYIIDTTPRRIAEEGLRKLNKELEETVKGRTQELVEMLEREKEINEMKSRFVTMASHEFRTPLSAILSSLCLIESYEGTENAKKNHHINRIRSSVKHLNDLLDDFLTLDKLQLGKIELKKESFDLVEVLDEVIAEGSSLLKTGQHVDYTHSGERQIHQDKRILKNIVSNLLSNASKYSAENKHIHLSSEVLHNTVLINVCDEGIGIPEREQGNIFEKFFRAKNAVNIQGTGLGLIIVKRYLELMDGEVRFRSNMGEGTTFTIEFPKSETPMTKPVHTIS